MKPRLLTLFAAMMAMGFSASAAAKDKTVAGTTRTATEIEDPEPSAIMPKDQTLKGDIKICIQSVTNQLKPLKDQKNAVCLADETALACVALKEQISALKAQIKDCRKATTTDLPPAPAQ